MNEIKFVLISLYRSVSMGGCLDFRGGISHKLFMLVTATINIRKAEEDNVLNLWNFLSHCHSSFI